jgi:hypothetical protein
MIDTVAILVTSLLVIFIAVRAAIQDSRERSETERGRPFKKRADA